MRDVLGPGTVLGYCTNVHAGATLEDVLGQLERYAVAVKQLVSREAPLDVGLWLPESVHWPKTWFPAEQDEDGLHRRVRDLGLRVFTLNAFPMVLFHDDVVKQRVYAPDWGEAEDAPRDSWSRRDYTFFMWEALLPAIGVGGSGSISTLPIGWPGGDDSARCREAGSQLRALAEHLEFCEVESTVELTRGRHVTIDLEPEPGCILDTCDDVIAFFDEHLPDEVHRRHIGVCHDVCHAAVMFEDQEDVLRRYAEAGIRVNKVQISSCPRAPGEHCSESSGTREEMLDALRAFVEPRYLHQTMVRTSREEDRSETGPTQEFFEDLPDAFAALDARPELAGGEWRTHFHVPVYLERIGALATTRDQIMPAILAARKYHDTRFFEVETYAWGVLPESAKEAAWSAAPLDEWLAEGIARELLWVKGEAEKAGLSA